MALICYYNFMTCLSGTCKCNVCSKIGSKMLTIRSLPFLNLLSARQPYPALSLNSKTVRYLESCLIFVVCYVKELNTPLVSERRSSIRPMQTRLLFAIKDLIHLMQSEIQQTDQRDYLAASRSFCVCSVLARLRRFSSICMGSLGCLRWGRGELPSIAMPDMTEQSLRQSCNSLMID